MTTKRQWIAAVLCLFGIGDILLTSYLLTDPWEDPIVTLLWFPRFSVETMLRGGAQILVGSDAWGTTLPTAYWLLGCFLTLLAIGGGILIARWSSQRITDASAPFPWLALFVVFYTTHLLLLAPSGDPKLAWSVPASEVSAAVERRLMGPFYLLGRYLERDSPRLYNFESSALGFRMMESAASTVYTLHDIESVDLYNLSDSSRRPEDPAISNAFLVDEGKATFVDGLSCAASSEVSIPVVLNEMADEASLPACRALGYWGRTIFDTTDPFVVSGATVSFDGRWMLLRLTKQPFAGRDYVYLIDLRTAEEPERFPL